MQLFQKTNRKPVINLAPLIDILFILIIFFVVSSKIIGDEGIDIALPQSNQGQVQSLALPILILTADQQLILNDTPILKEELNSMLIQLGGIPETLMLKIDERVSHGTVIGLMDLIKSIGVQKIVFGTEFQPSQPVP